jgi:cellulose synthase/poly-beta-1,6-N-acetylglucosamine synthase-like glycosyltransferase
VFFTDVRQPLDPRALSLLVANFADASVGAVTGELRYFNTGLAGEQEVMELYWRYELWARNHHSRIDSIFAATGCIYAVRRSLAGPIPTDTLADDAVIPLRVYLRGYRVVFDPEALAFDYPTAEGWEFRRKLRTLAGMWQVYIRMPELLTRPGRMRFHFLSHKFARLVLPWAMLMVLAGTGGLAPSPLRTCLLAGEAVLAGLALADFLVPKRFPLKHITAPARSFLAMNAAALFSVLVFLVPPEKLWGTTRVKTSR